MVESNVLIDCNRNRIMKKRCKGCIAPLGFKPDPMCADFKRFVDNGEMLPLEACWSCFKTCTAKNIATGKTQLCRGSAEYFGAVA